MWLLRRILWLATPILWSGGMVNAFLMDLNNMDALKILAMNNRFTDDNILDVQKHELFKKAGYNDYELFINRAITKDQYLESVKKTFKDEMITSFLEQGGIDISQPIWQKVFFNEDEDKIFAEMIGVQEPLKSIIRLIKSDDTDESEYGQKLLKKYQYKSFNNPNGGAFEQNMDHFMLADSDGKKKLVKDILSEEMFKNIQDPIQKAIMKMWHKSMDKDLTDAEKDKYKQNIKDLQYIQMFESQLPEKTPIKQEDLYLFYKLTDGRISAGDLVNVATGDEIGPINDLDFEYFFGASAKEFTCRAHEPSMRIQCGVELKPDECVSRGCCYDEQSATKCFHSLYGKIGSSVARKMLINENTAFVDQIESLFTNGGTQIPTLDLILRDSEALPYGVQLYDETGNPIANKLNNVGQTDENYNWWDQSKLKSPEAFKPGPNGEVRESIVLSQKTQRKNYGRPGFEWKPHGPTASPFMSRLPGINPTADPLFNGLSDLDDYYKKWLSFANAHDSYQCSLIPKNSRVTCMPNFKALSEEANNPGGNNNCQAAGCCFSEESFLKGEDACYRAIDYGTCTGFPKEYKKKECGYDGITEQQCLSNVQCCFNPVAEAGVPWCHYKMSATIDDGEDGWCEAWTDEKMRHVKRPACFVPKTGKDNLFTDDEASNINNLVNREQCENAGCCYDDSLNVDEIDFLKDGLGLTEGPKRCFKKTNPYIKTTYNGIDYGNTWQQNGAGKFIGGNEKLTGDNIDYYEIGGDIDPLTMKNEPFYFNQDPIADKEFQNRKVLTCDSRQWVDMFKFKRSCGENLSYYQCVYVNKCCYRPNYINQPSCYKPELTKAP